MLRPDEATKNSIVLIMTRASEMPVMTKCCAFSCLPGDYEDDEPMMFMEVEVTLSGQIEMGNSSSSNFLSRLETNIGTKEAVVVLSLKVLKIRLKDARNLY